MKLSCKVIEDMLPMYYDGVCSDESAMLVEEHLRDCPRCSHVLSALHSEIELRETPVDDLKPLERIQEKWAKSKRTYLVRGICIALAALLLAVAVLCGIWYFSYGTYWHQLTEVMGRPTKDDNFVTSSDYVLEKDGYRFDACLPIVLSNSGFVRIMDQDGLVLFLYPEPGGSYSFWFYMTDEDNQAYSVYLKSDMSPDFENHQFPVRTETQKEQITQMLTKQHDGVVAILDAVQELWGIDLLQYAP